MGSYGDRWLMCAWCCRWGKCLPHYSGDFVSLFDVDGIGPMCTACLEAPAPPEQPKVGDIVGFGHPDSNAKPRFYTAFPYGRQIYAEEAFVDTRIGVRVLEVATAAFDRWPANAWRGSSSRLTAWTRVNTEVDVYVGIKFVYRNWGPFWTNWSKNDKQWMHFVYDAGVLREPPLRTR